MKRREPVLPLESGTYQAASAVLRVALHDGKDPIEALNQAGLLVTPARANAMAAAGVDKLMESMFGWSAVEMLRRRVKGGTPGTPADMYEAVLSFVQEFAAHVKEKGL